MPIVCKLLFAAVASFALAAPAQARRSFGEITIAVGTHIATRPPHKTGRAALPHPASTSGI